MIGVIGFGMVGTAVVYGFSRTDCLISDPKYNDLSIENIVSKNPEALFVCVPTPEGENFNTLLKVLDEIKSYNYSGLTVVKSTVLPEYLESYDVIYNPEFLTRSTALQDFVNPKFVIIGGTRGNELLELYKKYSTVDTSNTYLVDISTAAFIKYTMNSFYALKVTYMNAMYEVAEQMGANYNLATEILAKDPWMGSNHFRVPGPDGLKGYGGDCLPKDIKKLTDKYNIDILHKVIELNEYYRNI